MKRTCTEVFYITSHAGTRNNKYDDPWEAVKYLRSMPKHKQQMFGVTCVETYTYYNEDGSLHHRESYENWINEEDY